MMINKRLMGELKESKPYIVKNVVFQWIKLVANIIIICNFGLLLQEVYEGQYTNVVKKAILIALLIFVRFVFTVKANQASHHASSSVKKRLRDMLYEKLLKLGSSYHEKVTTAEVTQVAVEGIEQLETYIGKYLPQLFYSLLAPLTLFLVLSFVSIKAAIILLICLPLIPISIILFMKVAKKIMKKYWGSYANLGHTFLENLQGLTTLKIYEADEDRHQKMNEDAEDFRVITMKLLMMQLNSIIIMNFFTFGGAAIGLIIAINEFLNQRVEFWQAFIIIMLAAEFFIPVRLLGSFFHVAMNGTTAADKLFRIIDLEEDHIEPKLKEKNIDGNYIVFDDVTFSYDDSLNVLNKVSMNFSKGKFTSIVGQSGCGKSTIASLIMASRNKYSGHIFLNGIENRIYDEEKRMEHITLVTHDSYIFKGTVKENLQLGNELATDKEMLDALALVNLKDFILNEGGLTFMLNEQGSNLSGGQRQRLAIARSLLHNSEVYIFDEATSNIDVESEECIMNVVHEIAKTKTVILISHRLANVVKSDKIYVLDKGIIKESGSHEELMNQGVVYKKMYEQQSLLEQYGKGGTANA